MLLLLGGVLGAFGFCRRGYMRGGVHCRDGVGAREGLVLCKGEGGRTMVVEMSIS